MKYWICVSLAAAGMAAALPATASAQASGPRASPGLQQPYLRDDEQILPSQIVRPPNIPPKQKAAAKPPAPKPAPDPAIANAPLDENPVSVNRPPAPAKPADTARTVACGGAFAKNSDHLRLAQSFGVHNVEFTQVSGDDGSTLLASVLFPNDPKRRLEVLWDDDTLRSGTRMIVIDGASTWSAQKGLHLGLPLAALEKVNGKPFKLMGFEQNGMAIVSDWNGGALGLLTDGCKVGVQFKADPKVPAGVLGAAGSDKEFASSDPAIRAAKPTIGEIIVAY
jgi:hypothetical protein